VGVGPVEKSKGSAWLRDLRSSGDGSGGSNGEDIEREGGELG
jgi:hypothetical protein